MRAPTPYEEYLWRLGITYDRNLDASGGKKARGYRGICVQINPYFS